MPNRPALSADEWQKRASRHFDEVAPFDATSTNSGLLQAVHALAEKASLGKVEKAELQRLMLKAIRPRDQMLQQLLTKLVSEASSHQLPWEQNGSGGGAAGGAAGGATAASSSATTATEGMSDPDIAALQAKVDELKGALQTLHDAQRDRDEMAAKIKAVQRQLEAGPSPSAAERSAEPSGGDQAAAGEAEGSRTTPGFGRRAPGPTRQATGVDGASPMVPNKLQIDNLGQVTPLGATSISPEPGGFAAKREGSARSAARPPLSHEALAKPCNAASPTVAPSAVARAAPHSPAPHLSS